MFQSPTLFVLKDHFWNQNASVKVIERELERLKPLKVFVFTDHSRDRA